MKYALLILLLFHIIYDGFGDTSVLWQCIYFAAQYGFIATVAIIEIFRGKDMDFFIIAAFIWLFFSITELLWISTPKIVYEEMHGTPPYFALGICFVILFLLLIAKPLKLKLWNGSKRISGRH